MTAIFISSQKHGEFETLIDTCDLSLLGNVGSIHVWWSKKTKSYYAACNLNVGPGKWKNVKLHRVLFGYPVGYEIDHINHDTLDNRRSCNLRKVTKSENQQNRSGPTKRSKSGVRGVYWNKKLSKWQAAVRHNKKTIYLGLFEDIAEAEKVSIKARKELGFKSSSVG